MRRTKFGCLVAVTLVVGWLAPLANAQEKSARGTVTALGPSSITVKAGENNLTFAVDPKTVLTASGAGTADRAAEAAGKPGPKLSDFVKVGDNVSVSYTEAAGAMRAARIQKVNSAGSGGGGGSSSEAASATQNGTVTAIDGSTLTISGTGGGGSTFTQSYTVNRETKVVAVGAGTAAAAGGGGVALTSGVGVGDQVQVTYRPAGSTLHAEQVRVTAKKK
jgi:co-chaperonin GroES (HSP10)